MITGKTAESLFQELMSKECECLKSSREEDMFGHVDFICDGVTYDVKTQKKLNRWDKEAADIIWVELLNVRGNEGWLIGQADKIAFLSGNEFIIVDRLRLFEEIKRMIPNHEPLTVKGYKTWYRRKYRKDKVTYIYPSDIEHLIERRLALSSTGGAIGS